MAFAEIFSVLGNMRFNRTEGATLIVSVLVVMALLAVVLATTTTLSLSALRTTTDQRAIQQAQTGAESGVAFASARIQQARTLLATVDVPQGTTLATLQGLLMQYCGKSALTVPPEVITTPVLSCTADPDVRNISRLDIFKNYVDASAYADVNIPTNQINIYWQNLFGLNAESTTNTVNTSGTVTTSYSTNFHLVPTRVLQTGAASYQVMYQSAAFDSNGNLNQGSVTTASRKITVAPSNELYVVIQRPAFNAFAQFRDLTTSGTGGGQVGGSQLYFGDGEEFNGPVHTNSKPGFIGTPKFYSQFSTASNTYAPSGQISSCNTITKLTDGTCTAMFPNLRPKFNQPRIDLPDNNNNQLRATVGLNAENFSSVTNVELQTAWGVNSVANNTVYYTRGNGTAANTGSSWVGGLYVNGDANVTFSLTAEQRQQIKIVQGSTTNIFEKNVNGTWSVRVNGGTPKTITGNFNGMIYSTGNLNVYGDGNNITPDIASDTQITLTNAGDNKNILLKDSVTYVDDPAEDPTATNVLGIYASGGNILLDGPNNKDLIMNASILATRAGKGFGSVNAGTSRYTTGSQPKIILTGGVIESQSQTVSSGNGGYRRNYTYDTRFSTGFSPPYFPLQQRWTSEVDPSPLRFGFWKQSQ